MLQPKPSSQHQIFLEFEFSVHNKLTAAIGLWT